jgi:hypothetical protein
LADPAGHRCRSTVFAVAAHAPDSAFKRVVVDEEKKALRLDLPRMQGQVVELEMTY